jgi:hypothetical protein
MAPEIVKQIPDTSNNKTFSEINLSEKVTVLFRVRKKPATHKMVAVKSFFSESLKTMCLILGMKVSNYFIAYLI